MTDPKVQELIEAAKSLMQSDGKDLAQYARLRRSIASLESAEKTGLSREIREYLWLSHGCCGLYGDDGEMQCSSTYPFIDFRRDSEEIVLSGIMAHKAAKKYSAEEWIEIKEGCEMPEDGEPVIIVWSGVVQHLTYARFEGTWYPYHEDPEDFIGLNEDINLVSHWTLLPAPPSTEATKEPK